VASELPPPATPLDEAGEQEYAVPSSGLTRVAAGGATWRFTGQVVRELTRLVVAIVLARILTPEEWGLATMALVVAAFVELVPGSIAVGMVQRSSLSELDRSSLFWTILVVGVGLTTIGIAASGAIADFYGEPDVQPLFMVASLGFTIAALNEIPEALLIRDFAYRALEIRQMAAVLVGGATALTLALAGAGSWAVVSNSLALMTTSCILVWMFVSWRPRLVFSRSSMADLGGDGARVLGTNFVTCVQLYSDKFLIGRHLGSGAVGIYSLATQLMFTPVVNIAYPLQYVLFPVMASIQHEAERLNAAWLRVKRVSVAVMAPIFVCFLVIAPDLVVTVFGSKWEDSVPILQLLSIAGVAYSLTTQNWTLLVVRERTGVLLGLTILNAAVVVLAVVVGLSWGVNGVAAMLASAYWALALPEMLITTRAGSVPFLAAFKATLSPVVFAAAAAAAAYGLRVALVDAGLPVGARMFVVAGFLFALYAALALAGSRALRREAASAVRYARRRRAARAATAA
jgi:O-antigen/teichoic acid export membrane protein